MAHVNASQSPTGAEARPLQVEELRRVQRAANMLGLAEFCRALGWERDDYARDKWKEFQGLGRLHVFDDNTLRALVAESEAHRG